MATFVRPPINFIDAAQDASAPVFPDISFFGGSYDLLHTDPVDYANGAGQRAPAVELTIADNPPVGMKFRFPQNAVVLPTPGGTTDLSFQQIFRESDYQSAFSETATIKAGVPVLFSFSLSESFQQATATSNGFKSSSLYVTREVRIVNVQLASNASMAVSAPFADKVGGLSTSSADSSYQDLINIFGTHYATAVQFGGRAFQFTTVSASTMSSMVSQQIDIKAGASGAFDVFTASGSGQFDMQNTQRYQQATSSSRTIQNFSGGTNFNSLDQWAPTVAEQPVPVALSLAPLSDLLTADNFPNDSAIATKQVLLLQAIDAYLQTGVPTDTPQPLMSGSTKFALVDQNGLYAARQDDSNNSPLTLSSSNDSSSTWMYNNTASSPLQPNVGMALTSDQFSGHAGLNSSRNYAMGSNNTFFNTMLVSVFNDPSNPSSTASGMPTQLMTGDQVYVISTANQGQISGLAMQSSGSSGGSLPGVAPMIGDRSIVWTITAV